MKSYIGRVEDDGCVVEVLISHPKESGHWQSLRSRRDLADHSPTGFAWGYGGSGPAQLALAIVADFLGDDHEAISLYQQFKWLVIAPLPGNKPFELDEQTVREAIERCRHGEGGQR